MTDLRTAALRALKALEAWEDAAPSQWTTRDEKTIATLREALAQPEDKSQAAFEHWVETVEATQGCAISRNAVVDKLLTITPAQMAHAEAVENLTVKESLTVEPCNKSCAPGYCYCEPEAVRRRIMETAYDLADDGNFEGYNAVKVMCSDVLKMCKDTNEPIIQPEIKGHNVKPPPEAQTEAEKIAYCAGWWAAMEAKQNPQEKLLPWKGLTEEEHNYYKACGFVGVKAVEEKLRAKNSTLACIPAVPPV
jgi:hypothetical protein